MTMTWLKPKHFYPYVENNVLKQQSSFSSFGNNNNLNRYVSYNIYIKVHRNLHHITRHNHCIVWLLPVRCDCCWLWCCIVDYISSCSIAPKEIFNFWYEGFLSSTVFILSLPAAAAPAASTIFPWVTLYVVIPVFLVYKQVFVTCFFRSW